MIPLLIGAGAVAAGAAIAGSAAGVGKSKFQAQSYKTAKNAGYNSRDFNYRGANGQTAREEQSAYANRAAQSQQRGGPVVDQSGTNLYDQRGLAAATGQQGALSSQQDAMALQRDAAMGNAPSRAEILGQQQMQPIAAQQQSMAASARGPAGLAMAQRQAAGNTALSQVNSTANTQAMRADEMARARGDYAGAANAVAQQTNAMRASELAAQQQQAQQAQFGAGLEMQQRGLNDQRENNMYGASRDVGKTTLSGTMAKQGMLADSFNQAQAVNAGVSTSNAAAGAKLFSAGVGGVTGAMMGGVKAAADGAASTAGQGGGTGSDVRMKNTPQPLNEDAVSKMRARAAMLEQAIASGTTLDAMEAQKPAAAKGKPRVSDDVAAKMRARAFALEEQMAAGHEASLAQGPAVRKAAAGRPESGYDTELTSEAEKAFQAWRARTSPHDTGRDYDLRGAFADGLDRDGRGHLPDTYKKPNHETFSDESQYAQFAPAFAGMWNGEQYTPKGPPPQLREAMAMPGLAGASPMLSDERAKKEAYNQGRLDGESNVEKQFAKRFQGGQKSVATVLEGAGDEVPRAYGVPSQEEQGRMVPTTTGDPMEDYLATTRPALYEYKDPNMPGAAPGPQVGPASAQQMEKTAVGSTVVGTDPNTGLKYIDQPAATKATMSAVSHVNDKVNALSSMMSPLAMGIARMKKGGR